MHSLTTPCHRQDAVSVRVEEYDWSSEVPAELGAVPFDVVLGTDVAYYEHLYAPFLQVTHKFHPVPKMTANEMR